MEVNFKLKKLIDLFIRNAIYFAFNMIFLVYF